VALLLGNAIILYGNLDWFWLRWPAAVTMMFVLPGWAWLPCFGWLHTRQAIERIVLVVGLSSLLSALVLLVTVLLPGPFTEPPVMIALNLAILAGLGCQLIPAIQSKIHNQKAKIEWPSRNVLLILLAILAVAAFTRFSQLSYAEFHEDELENMRLIVRAYKGEEYAPFLDSKGPIHWLLPAALWYLNGWLTEGLARTPFALTSLLLIPAMYVLGKRLSSRDDVGLLAAGFVAVNGFFVAYARYVENPSLIVFWGALAMWFAYRYYQESTNTFLLWMALALAVGLVTHPDVLLYLPVCGYIVRIKLYRTQNRYRQWPWLLAAGGLFVGVMGIFYIPYLTDPNIGAVQQYFAQERIGQSLLYNRVYNLFDQDQLYTTRYHAPVLVLLLAWLLARNFVRWGRLAFGLLALAIVTTVAWPQVWIIGTLNLAFGPYALLTLLFILLPRTTIEMKTLLLWLAVPLGALLFLAKDAADHVQIAYPAWALLASFALVDLWAFLGSVGSPVAKFFGASGGWRVRLPAAAGRVAKTTLVLVLTLSAGLILYYQYLAFLSPVTAYWQVKIDYTNNPNSIYTWLYGSIPRPRKIFSNPRLGGWKAVGYLWENGTLSGDFRSVNESFAVPIWYTFQTPRSCYTDPENYWLRRDWEEWPEEETDIVAQGYTLTHVVLVDRQPKLHLYQQNTTATQPEIVDMEEYRHRFDRLATPARFARGDAIEQPASYNFGDRLLLRGYNLQPIANAGQRLPVTMYWQSLAPMDIRYRAFVHLLGPDNSLWAQHDDDPACRLLTTDMRPGQLSSRQFRLPIGADTPPGEYTVVLGVYHPQTLERLDIWDNQARQSPGNRPVLGKAQIK